ncbi:MAG: glycosyltransferase [Candidatus Heimdallarchaeota archaeon]|nr:glycosyltransferase [Candidatus Heimdallarchaeota archaeon]
MLLSVIISCYQSEKHIKSCLQALISQTHSSMEIIVVDAGSSDRTLEIIETQFPNVTLIKEKRIGVGRALNRGLNIATGDLIAIDFNTDEVAREDWAEELVRSHLKFGPGLIIGTTRLKPDGKISEQGIRLRFTTFTHKLRYNEQHDPNSLIGEVDFVGLSSFRQDLLNRNKEVDEKYLFYGADADFNLRARLNGYKVITNPKAVTTHEGSAISSRNGLRFTILQTYGGLRLVFLHGSKKRVLITVGYTLFYLNFVYLCMVGLNLVSRGRISSSPRLKMQQILGRIIGVYKFVRKIPEWLIDRRSFNTKILI